MQMLYSDESGLRQNPRCHSLFNPISGGEIGSRRPAKHIMGFISANQFVPSISQMSVRRGKSVGGRSATSRFGGSAHTSTVLSMSGGEVR
jgi:hypothetical protein